METCLNNLEGMFKSGVSDIHFKQTIAQPWLLNWLFKKTTSRYEGIFDNESYFNAIDTKKSGSIEELNKIVRTNAQNPISNLDFIDFQAITTIFKIMWKK